MTNMDKIIQGLWVRGDLNSIQLLSINSFLKNGHQFHLYTYNKNINIPQGTIVKDASEILPARMIFVDDIKSLSTFSDLFRYNLLYEKGGWWVDLDQICLQPFIFNSNHVFATECIDLRRNLNVINIGVIKVPKRSQIMKFCVDRSNELYKKYYPNIKWASFGKNILYEYMQNNHEFYNFLQPPHVFCPIPAALYELYFLDFSIDFLTTTYSAHLWYEMIRSNETLNVDIMKCPSNSFFERLKKKIYI